MLDCGLYKCTLSGLVASSSFWCLPYLYNFSALCWLTCSTSIRGWLQPWISPISRWSLGPLLVCCRRRIFLIAISVEGLRLCKWKFPLSRLRLKSVIRTDPASLGWPVFIIKLPFLSSYNYYWTTRQRNLWWYGPPQGHTNKILSQGKNIILTVDIEWERALFANLGLYYYNQSQVWCIFLFRTFLPKG